MSIAPVHLQQLLIGIGLAFAASIAGWRLGWLKLNGAVAAFCMGVVVFGLGGFAWSVPLLVFFVTSSLLSKLFRSKKSVSEKYAAKGATRDAKQVLANGGVASLFVILHSFFPTGVWTWVGFSAAFAAANADTWATEIGVLSKRQPRLITNGKIVEKGTSGGISLEGILGTIAGSAAVAAAAGWAWPMQDSRGSVWMVIAILICGVAGSLVDSLLGATVQRVNYCPKCQKETEKEPLHTCGENTEYLRGWRWLDNDWVNFLCTLAAALTAILWYVCATLL